MISPNSENAHRWDSIPIVLMGRSQAPCAWNGTLRRGLFTRALKEEVIRPCTEPDQNWDTALSREPSIPCEWVGAGRNRAHDSGPARTIRARAYETGRIRKNLAESPLSPHGCLVGRPVHRI